MDESSDGSIADNPAPSDLSWPTVGDVHRALRPLQEEADRVGKQVEEFAETLDRLGDSSWAKPQNDCTNALLLVDRYRDIARRTVDDLRGLHAPEKHKRLGQQLRGKFKKSSAALGRESASSRDHTYFTTLDDLERWEQEEQTWHLLGLMLQVEYPSKDSKNQAQLFDERLVRPAQGNVVHRYSAEQAVWSRFLAHDDQAWERHTVVEWLKTSANESGQDIEKVVEELEASANRGSGLWAHSWLYSKEAIKGQKRLRSWPQALALDSPGIDTSLRKSDDSRSLITQLDPDAVTRQDRGLEKEDESFERATWLACWEMVRRGKDWAFIREWWQERVESWRAVSMRGQPRLNDQESGKPVTDPSISPTWQSRVLWRKSCALAARTGAMDQYEAAVYGVLSGYLPSILKVCTSWNDHLFAHYNSYLLRSYEQYVANEFPDRIPQGLQGRNGIFKFSMTGGRRAQSGNQLVEKLSTVRSIAKESKDPFKLLQGSLVGKSFESFVRSYGLQLARQQELASKRSKGLVKTKEGEPEEDKMMPVKLDDYQIIRVVTHVLLIFQGLAPSRRNIEHDYGSETFVDAYIDFLSKAGKQQLLPLYASRLSPRRAASALGRQLPSIMEYGERQTMMRLMKQYDLDVPGTLNSQLQTLISNAKLGMEDDTPGGAFPDLIILEPRSEKNPREFRAIKEGFMGNGITDDQNALIMGFEWYLLLEGYWEQTMATGMDSSKGLSAARDLSERVTFESISVRKTKAILGREINLYDVHHDSLDDDFGFVGVDKSTIEAEGEKERFLLRQSDTFRNLEQLLYVLGALEHCQDEMKQKPPREYLLKCLELGAAIASKDSDLASTFVATGRMAELVDALAAISVSMLHAEESAKGGKKGSAKLGIWSGKVR
ncbi:MAG: hypothetical protein Q9174_000256 [Haloplaca sp. 1 TL-2023]